MDPENDFATVHEHTRGVTARSRTEQLVRHEQIQRLNEMRDARLVQLRRDIYNNSFHARDCFGVLKALVNFAPQVCIILSEKSGVCEPRGTGFHVGNGLILTAKHVVVAHDSSVYFANFCFESAVINPDQNIRINQSDQVIVGGDLDAVFLEMNTLPQSPQGQLQVYKVQRGFCPNRFDFGSELPGCVHLIGHFNGEMKSIDRNSRVESVAKVKEELDSYYSFDWIDQPLTADRTQAQAKAEDSKLLDNNKHILITCWFLHGASGAPVLRYCEKEKMVKVVAVYCCGMPTSHYDRRVPRGRAEEFDKEMQEYYATFEAGLKLSVIRDAITEPRMKPPGW